MAYCSELVIIANEDFNKKLNETLNKLAEDSQLRHPDKTIKGKGCQLYHWKKIRWNILHEDITTLENLLLQEESSNYRVIRVGDTVDDIEDQGFFESPFYPAVSVNIEFDELVNNA